MGYGESTCSCEKIRSPIGGWRAISVAHGNRGVSNDLTQKIQPIVDRGIARRRDLRQQACAGIAGQEKLGEPVILVVTFVQKILLINFIIYFQFD